MFRILILIVLVILIILVLCSTDHSHNHTYHAETYRQYKPKPEHKPYLWVYWELINGVTTPPPYISMCLELIRKVGAKCFNVVLLNEKNIFEYIPDLRKDINTLPIALKTDYIRIKLLYMYGGLWVDADTILMNDLCEIATKLNDGTDFIGFGCTGAVCKDQEGYYRPSNGVMGSVKNGRLVEKCLAMLDTKLNEYYSMPKNERKDFDYFDLGKKIVWDCLDEILIDDPSYKSKIYHVPSFADGTRDINGHWIAKDLIFNKRYTYAHPDKLLVIMLANSSYCGKDPYYNWFCKLSKDQIMNGDYFISDLFRQAYQNQSALQV